MHISGSFTVPVASSRYYVLETDIKISVPWDPSRKQKKPPLIQAVGIWDTGATNTVFDASLIQELGLVEVDTTQVITSNGRRTAKVYLANVYLPENMAIDGIQIIDGEVLGRPNRRRNVLIGMDIISRGDFIVSNYQNQMKFTFRMPSQGHPTIS